MNGRLQGFLGEIRHAPFFPVYAFFLTFFVLKAVFSYGFAGALFLAGYLPPANTQVLENNEVFIQTLSLVIALWGVLGRGSRGARATLREFLGESILRWPSPMLWVSESLNPILRGFVVASLGVLVMLLSGFLILEGQLSVMSLFMLPAIALRAALLVLWVAVLELTRLKLSRLLAHSGLFEVVGLMVLTVFEAYLLYSVLKIEGAPLEQAFMGLVALWWASLLGVWTLVSGRDVMSSWKRVCVVASLLVSLTCVYGFPLAWGRVASLTSVYPGPNPWAQSVLPSPGLLGQWSFILIFSAFFAGLLRRVLTQTRNQSI